MPTFSVAEIVAAFVFGSKDFVPFIYGKRMQVWTPMIIGLALMIYPYFVPDMLVLGTIGGILTALLFSSAARSPHVLVSVSGPC